MNAELEDIKEINEMKAIWAKLNERISHLEEENKRLANDIIKNRYKSSIDALKDRYKKFIALELIFAILIPLTLWFNPEVVEKYRMIAILYWFAFFAIEMVFDYYLLERVKDMDIYEDSISEIGQKALANWKLHKLEIMLGFPLAIGAAVLYGFAIDANEFIFMGMGAGALVGAIIGFRQLMRFRRDYRNLLNPE